MLRIARLTPWEVLRDVFLQLQRTLVPPILGFGVVFTVYLVFFSDASKIMGFGRSAFMARAQRCADRDAAVRHHLPRPAARARPSVLLSAFLCCRSTSRPLRCVLWPNRWTTSGMRAIPCRGARRGCRTNATAYGVVYCLALLFYVAGIALVVGLLLWLGHDAARQLWHRRCNRRGE